MTSHPVSFLDALRIQVRDGGRMMNPHHEYGGCHIAIGMNMGGIKSTCLRTMDPQTGRLVLGIGVRLNVSTEAAKGRLHRLALMGSTALQKAM
ncbi:hypothetical protein [Corynebacterium sp.]|uniref:hypothetical protein n=1 Tax=Corynebacterium sp. TaxID=1720 RepID=UPI0026DB1DB7|nr:hypothetical protein [Corynebacterium sp.]MDO5077478.1 hypothetical protein [Corynebacterium sp.]